MVIDVKPVGLVAGISGSGGSQPPRILRPNLAHLNSLRGSMPAILAQDRPLEIRRIAIVDDEPAIARLLVRSLKFNLSRSGVNIREALITGDIPQLEEGHTLIMSTNISELPYADRRAEIIKVPDVLLSQGVDILFTDFNMPGLTGEQIVQDIRGRGYKGIIVGLTGRPNDNTKPFYDAGADLVLDKPFNINHIFNLFA